MPRNIQANTSFAIRDLHARESMRLGWYRMLRSRGRIKALRARKAQHADYLRELLRRRDIRPIWYARLFYRLGNGFGLLSRELPETMIQWLEQQLERWILLRYRKYLRRLELDESLRTMVEALQLERLPHAEPAADVLELLHRFIHEEQRYQSETVELPNDRDKASLFPASQTTVSKAADAGRG